MDGGAFTTRVSNADTDSTLGEQYDVTVLLHGEDIEFCWAQSAETPFPPSFPRKREPRIRI